MSDLLNRLELWLPCRTLTVSNVFNSIPHTLLLLDPSYNKAQKSIEQLQ